MWLDDKCVWDFTLTWVARYLRHVICFFEIFIFYPTPKKKSPLPKHHRAASSTVSCCHCWLFTSVAAEHRKWAKRGVCRTPKIAPLASEALSLHENWTLIKHNSKNKYFLPTLESTRWGAAAACDASTGQMYFSHEWILSPLQLSHGLCFVRQVWVETGGGGIKKTHLKHT